MYEKLFVVGWADVDFNQHMRNSAFLDKCSDVRVSFFGDNGFPFEEFARRQIGPVVRKDEIEYFREFRLAAPVRVTLALAGQSDDGSRFRVRNEFFQQDGTLAARVRNTAGWLDLGARKLVAPPPELLAVMRLLSRTDDFEVLASSVRK